MAKILKSSVEIVEIKPKNGRHFTLEELQGVVGGYIEIVRLSGNQFMVVNEEGKLMGLPFNSLATNALRLAYPQSDDIIVGDVLLCMDNEIK